MRRLINAAGPITPLGAGIVAEPVISAVNDVLRRSVEMAELQAIASAAISNAFGSEAGAVVGCTAAGITLGVAAAMTGPDVALVEQLPDTRSMKNRVILQRGHDCWFGARIGQMIRLSGAQVDYIGTPEQATANDIDAAISPGTAAALFVASHHVTSHGMVSLAEFIQRCRQAGVPVIVDAAGTVDASLYVKAGASLVLASAHKNFGGLTAGIVCGTKTLVDACLLQDRGIGRPMKVGKEGIASVIAGLEQWRRRPLADRELEWKSRAERICRHLNGVAGVTAELETDPPEDRIYRARVGIEPGAAGLTARQLAHRLSLDDVPVRVWEAGIGAGYFALDPRCLSDGEADRICERIRVLSSR